MTANEMLDMIRRSLEAWPNAGGDIEIAKAVGRIEKKARLAEAKYWVENAMEMDQEEADERIAELEKELNNLP